MEQKSSSIPIIIAVDGRWKSEKLIFLSFRLVIFKIINAK